MFFMAKPQRDYGRSGNALLLQPNSKVAEMALVQTAL